MKKSGFTLIELLIVISIIGILSGVVLTVINVPKWQARSRDAVRLEELSVLSGALERYYADTNAYPNAGAYVGVDDSSGVVYNNLVPDYIKSIGKDPKNFSYMYVSYGNLQDFCLCAKMESDEYGSSGIPSTCPSPLPADYTYCIENTF